MTIRARAPDDLGHRIRHLGELTNAITQGLLRQSALGDVGVNSRPLADGSIGTKDRHCADGEIAVLAIVPTEAMFVVAGATGRHRQVPQLQIQRSVIGMNSIAPTATLVLLEGLSSVGSPAGLLTHHLTPRIPRPDDLSERQYEGLVAIEMGAQYFRCVPAALHSLLFEMSDAEFASFDLRARCLG